MYFVFSIGILYLKIINKLQNLIIKYLYTLTTTLTKINLSLMLCKNHCDRN